MTGNIDLESPVVRIFSRSVDRAEMGLPAVDRVVSAVLQELDERGSDEGVAGPRNLADTVIVPIRYGKQAVFAVGCLIFLECPVGDTVAAAFVPVIRLQRDGELILLAYACVNMTPWRARRSMLGVSYTSL